MTDGSALETRIAVMAKAPVAGAAKTRLAPALGAVGAALLAARLLDHAVEQAVAAGLGAVTLWAAPDASHPAFVAARRRHGVTLAVQADGDLGERMAAAFDAAFAESPAPVLLIGSDAPALDAKVLRAAAAALVEHPAVFVPALDGGYVLVGLRAAAPSLFDRLTWSTPQVMAETRKRLLAAGLRHAELPPLPDIDEPADLVHVPAAWLATSAQPREQRPDAPIREDNRRLRPTASDSFMHETEPLPDDIPATAPAPAALEAPANAQGEADPAQQAAAPTVTTTELPQAADATLLAGIEEPAESAGPAGIEAASAAPLSPPPATLPDLSPAACAALLAERFPALFGAGKALPIKLRIQADIQQRAPGVFPRKALSVFLHRYTTCTPYIKALAEAPQRHDLDGAAAGEVAAEHRLAAVAEVERRRELAQARRIAERDAHRQAAAQARQGARREAASTGVPAADALPAAGENEPAPQAERQHPPRPQRPSDAMRRGRADGGGVAARGDRNDRNDRGAAKVGHSPGRRDAEDRRPRSAPEVATDHPAGDLARDSARDSARDHARDHASHHASQQTPHADSEARRERATLLRTYDGSTLTRANFCALKRITEADLETSLSLARQEREERARERPPEPPRREARHDTDPPLHAGRRADARDGSRAEPRADTRTGPRPDTRPDNGSKGPRPPFKPGR